MSPGQIPAPRTVYSRINGFIAAIGRQRTVEGVRVVATPLFPSVTQLVLDRVESALQLIAQHDLRRLRRLRQDVRCIVIGVTTASDAAYDSHGFIVVSLEAAARRDCSPLDLALLLVHEATHARFGRVGIGYDAPIRARVERACVRSELVFAERLPSALREQAVPRLRAWLDAPSPDFSDRAFVERKARDGLRVGLPKWFVSWVRRRDLGAVASRERAVIEARNPPSSQKLPHN